MRTTLIALISAVALGPLASASPAAAQDATHALPNYRPGDFVQGMGIVLAAPFVIAFSPTLEALPGGLRFGNCQRNQTWTGRHWRTVTVCN
jgi:hypothetical protein